MPQGMKDIVLFGKEAVARGTLALTFPLHQPFLGDGLVPALKANLGEVLSSSTWPYRTDQVPLGVEASLALTPDINVATVRDLIDLVTKRTSGDQQSVSIKHSRAGVGDAQYLGCLASQLSLEYSRSGSPDQSSLLSGSLSFETMKAEAGSGVSAGTQGNGRRFNLAKSTFTINSVGALEVLSYSRSITVEHALGFPDSANKRVYIEDGDVDEAVTLTARFSDLAWTSLVLNATEHAATIVHATGSANETVTETMGKVQVESHELSKQDGTVVEQITLKPFHTGAANPTVWTYGTLIGASVLVL